MAELSHPSPPLDVATLRKDFPLLAVEVHGHPITYLDSASSAQRPVQVLDAMRVSSPEDEPIIPITAADSGSDIGVLSGDPNHPL